MIGKGVPRAKERAKQKRQDAIARRKCCDAVWARAASGCESCGRFVRRGATFFRDVGHVDELTPRSQGGDPHDPLNCRLLCYECHFSGPSGAHRVTPNWRQGGLR